MESVSRSVGRSVMLAVSRSFGQSVVGKSVIQSVMLAVSGPVSQSFCWQSQTGCWDDRCVSRQRTSIRMVYVPPVATLFHRQLIQTCQSHLQTDVGFLNCFQILPLSGCFPMD